MILDKALMFSDEQAVTSTAVSTNIIDTDKVAEYGNGDPGRVRVQVQTAMVRNTDSDLKIVIQGSADNSTWVDYLQSPVYAEALAAGRVLFDVRLPIRKSGAAKPRYYRINYVNAATAWTSGKLDAFMVVDSEQRFD